MVIAIDENIIASRDVANLDDEYYYLKLVLQSLAKLILYYSSKEIMRE